MQPSLFERVCQSAAPILDRAGIAHERFESSARILAVSADGPDGFDVEVTDGDEEVLVSWGHGHAYFADEAGALKMFFAGLTARGRLTEICRGDSVVRSVMEYRTPDGWHCFLDTRYWPSPFWRRKHVRVLQNQHRFPHELLDGLSLTSDPPVPA